MPMIGLPSASTNVELIVAPSDGRAVKMTIAESPTQICFGPRSDTKMPVVWISRSGGVGQSSKKSSSSTV